MSDLVFIKADYFKNNSTFEEMLDPFNLTKQTQRQYLYIRIQYNNNNILVPLRNILPGKNPKLYYPVPSQSRPNAGLDYRKILIVNNSEYIETPTEQRLSNSQLNNITSNYDTIEKAVLNYIKGYIKSASKNREHLDYEYNYSTLHNFHQELGIVKVKDEVALTNESNTSQNS